MCRFCEQAAAEAAAEAGGDAGSGLTAADRLEAESCGTLRAQRLPCVVLTGILGAGKTTLLRRILTESGLRIAVIENEVGQESIDDKLLRDDKARIAMDNADEVVLMPNGCMCCRVRGDLVDTFKRLIGRAKTLDGVVLELSGLSSLAPVVQTFFSDSFVQRSLQLDSVICVIDGLQSDRLLLGKSTYDGGPEAAKDFELLGELTREQISLSDTVILNKLNARNDGKEIEIDLRESIKQINRTCRIETCALRDAPLPEILQPGRLMKEHAFSLKKASELSDILLFVDQPSDHSRSESHDHHHHHHHHHSDATHHEGHGHNHGDGNGHGNHHHENGHHRDKVHTHDSLGFATMSVTLRDGPLDWGRLRGWIETSIIESCPDALIRYKGLLWSRKHGQDIRVVMQGVFGHVDFVPQGLYMDEDKYSVLVFIGALDRQNLRERLEKGVRACLFDKEELASENAALGKPLTPTNEFIGQKQRMLTESFVSSGGTFRDEMLY